MIRKLKRSLGLRNLDLLYFAGKQERHRVLSQSSKTRLLRSRWLLIASTCRVPALGGSELTYIYIYVIYRYSVYIYIHRYMCIYIYMWSQRRNGLLVLANSVIPEGLLNRLTS